MWPIKEMLLCHVLSMLVCVPKVCGDDTVVLWDTWTRWTSFETTISWTRKLLSFLCFKEPHLHDLNSIYSDSNQYLIMKGVTDEAISTRSSSMSGIVFPVISRSITGWCLWTLDEIFSVFWLVYLTNRSNCCHLSSQPVTWYWRPDEIIRGLDCLVGSGESAFGDSLWESFCLWKRWWFVLTTTRSELQERHSADGMLSKQTSSWTPNQEPILFRCVACLCINFIASPSCERTTNLGRLVSE